VLAARTSDPGWEVQVLLRASDLFNRLGSSTEATALADTRPAATGWRRPA
jgi:hypothetical protein